MVNSEYDASWDLFAKEGYLPAHEDAYNKMFRKWKRRSWESWLKKNLVFPFFVERMEDEDDAFFTDVADKEPFRLGHVMKAIGIEKEIGNYGILLKVREGRKTGYVPLSDVEVTSKEDPNFWHVYEYVVWFANS